MTKDAHPNLREQLEAAEAGGGGGERISRSAELFGGRFAMMIGTLTALYLLVVVYIYPQRNAWLSAAATAAFVVCMVGTARWHTVQRRASSIGWSKRYSLAFAITAGLFGAGIALLDMTEIRDWWLWIPYATLTALPLASSRYWRGTK